MNDCDHELFEAELRKLTPARPPAALMARLVEARPAALDRAPETRESYQPATLSQPSTLNPQPLRWLLMRWLAPVAVAAGLAGLLLGWWPHAAHEQRHVKAVTLPPKLAPKPDEIEIDRQLVGLFDAVAQLPSGEPVRFRCREWTDEVVLRDPAHGLVIERRTPRLEVVPVSLEIF
jgi:hypothetical protein